MTWTAALVELKEFKRNTELFDADTWAAVDHCHGYLWWDAFGGDLSVIQGVACDILSKQCSASSCEFNWSSVSSIERKGRVEKCVVVVISYRVLLAVSDWYQLCQSILV